MNDGARVCLRQQRAHRRKNYRILDSGIQFETCQKSQWDDENHTYTQQRNHPADPIQGPFTVTMKLEVLGL